MTHEQAGEPEAARDEAPTEATPTEATSTEATPAEATPTEATPDEPPTGAESPPAEPSRDDAPPPDAPPPGGHGRHRPASARAGWFTRSHLLVGVLCAALGFAIVVQVRQTHADEFSALRQNDLVAILDEITQRNEQLEVEQAQLVLDRNDLEAGVGASEVAERNATVQAVLAGTVPVRGPGVEIIIRAGDTPIPVTAWVNLVEELRNAGAEAIEIGGVRFGAASWFGQEDGRVLVDGEPIEPAVIVRAIGDPQALEGGLQFRGGALPTLRASGAVTQLSAVEDVLIASVRVPRPPEIAEPAPEESAGTG